MTNPYVYAAPIQGREGFYGRASEMMRISSRIAAERPQSVSVVGEPKSGKTSLINFLCDPESQAEMLDDPAQYVLLRMELEGRPPRDPEEFFRQLAGVLDDMGEGPMTPTYDGFLDVVRGLMSNERRLIVFLDDFGVVTQNAGFPLEFFSFMRSVANNNDVGYLTTSWAPLQQLCHTQDIEESPFFNIFTTVNLEPFKEDAAHQLVEEPARQTGAPFEEEVEWILELGGSSPYLLQLAAGAAFEARGKGSISRESLADRAFGEARGFLTTVWEKHVTEVQREVLRGVGDGKRVEPRHEHAAENLERRGILRRADDGLVFTAELMARFVRDHGSGGFFRRLFS